MRGVLVDDHHARARLRHDVGLVQLRPRRPQRAVEEVRRRRLGGGARIRAGRDEALERRLPVFREPARRSAPL